MEAVEAQTRLVKIGLEVQKIDHQLYTLAAGLPRPANQDEMFECLIPCDLASGIYGAIEYVREDPLKLVIGCLRDASKLTVEELELRFRKLQEQETGGIRRGRSGLLRKLAAPQRFTRLIGWITKGSR